MLGGKKEREGLRRVRWDWVLKGNLCSSEQPLRKHSVPSGAGTGRLHLEPYQIFKNKGMCFPFAADPSAEVLCSGVANVFTRDAERVFLISSPLSLGDFQWLTYCVWRDGAVSRRWGGGACRRENEGKIVSVHTCLNAKSQCVSVLWGCSTESGSWPTGFTLQRAPRTAESSEFLFPAEIWKQ